MNNTVFCSIFSVKINGTTIHTNVDESMYVLAADTIPKIVQYKAEKLSSVGKNFLSTNDHPAIKAY